MKLNHFFLLLFVLLSGIACTKESDKDDPKDKTQLLTQKTWVYNELFYSYNTTATTVVYKRGKPQNAQNFDMVTVKFNTDGTFIERTVTGTTLNGTWKFLSNETQVETKHSQGTYVTNIISLTEDVYTWYDPFKSGGIYGENIHE